VSPFLQFLIVSCGYFAFAAGFFAFLLWAASFLGEKPSRRQANPSLTWAWLWPLFWLHDRISGSGARRVAEAVAPSTANRFKSVRDAKDYLAEVIAEEAVRQGTPLTEVERKMLYFTETGWTLPDMNKVAVEFDRNYNQDDCERRMAAIIGDAQSRLSADSHQPQLARWRCALEELRKGDHYLLVLANGASPHPPQKRSNHRHYRLKVLFVALILFALAALNAWFREWMRNH
jgi:hypothetical protein